VARQERLRRLEEDREQQRANEMLKREQREKEPQQREEERLAARILSWGGFGRSTGGLSLIRCVDTFYRGTCFSP
jgi:hypothetical protein